MIYIEVKLLTEEQNENAKIIWKCNEYESYEDEKICYVYKEDFENKYLEDIKYRKVRDHCY